MSQPAENSPKSWREMREWCARLLRSRTGQDVAAWNRRIAAEGLDDERALREWLTAEGVTGYAQALLVWERFGYPEFPVADADELIDEVDDEALGWLRRAHEQSTAPPPPPHPARRQAPRLGLLNVVIEGTELPGRAWTAEPGGPSHNDVHVALFTQDKDLPTLAMPGKPWQATQPVPGDAPAARWRLSVTVRRGDHGYDFSGPFVRGPRNDRHLGLAWGVLPGDGTLRLFRGAKLRLADVPSEVIEAAMVPGQQLVARVRLTDDKGGPVCARLRPSNLTWSAEPDTQGP